MLKYMIVLIQFLFVFNLNASVITFDPPPCSTCGYVKSLYEESGVSFNGSFTHYGMGSNSRAVNDITGGAIRFAYGSSMSIQLSSGALFTLHQVDLAEYSSVFDGDEIAVLFTGFKDNGTTVSQTFTIDGLRDGAGGIEDFETFIFSPGFTDLTHVEIGSDIFSMDNLIVSAIPIPAAIWLFGSGLIGLIGIARRKKA